MLSCERAAQHDQAAIGLACDPLDRFLNLAATAHWERQGLHPGRHHAFDGRQLSDPGVDSFVYDADAGCAGRGSVEAVVSICQANTPFFEAPGLRELD